MNIQLFKKQLWELMQAHNVSLVVELEGDFHGVHGEGISVQNNFDRDEKHRLMDGFHLHATDLEE